MGFAKDLNVHSPPPALKCRSVNNGEAEYLPADTEPRDDLPWTSVPNHWHPSGGLGTKHLRRIFEDDTDCQTT